MINNQTTYLHDTLRKLTNPESSISIQCGTPSLYAINYLLADLPFFKELRLLVSKPTKEFRGITQHPSDHQARTRLDINAVSTQLSNTFLKRTILKQGFCGTNVIIIKTGERTATFIYTVPDFDLQLLGVQAAKQLTLILPQSVETSTHLQQAFDNTWHEATPITEALAYKIERGGELATPRDQYHYTLSHLFEDYSRLEDREKIARSGFFDSNIWGLLYNFQKDAVLGAIDKIEKYGGCIIADSVGLGKTFEALGVMKYYQDRNFRILVLCPKRLFENWAVYRNNDRRNILIKDRYNYDLLFHTDLSREMGESNGVDLENFNWENFDLIVIDESHNFRNNVPSKKYKTRYERLMEDVLQKGVKTKVLMLSATPVNNKLRDLRNQVYFITEDDDHGLQKTGIHSINEVMRQAQKQFNAWLEGPTKDRDQLIEALDGRYFKILDLLTIARSRKHIEKYYDTKDIGTFPEKLRPQNEYADIDASNEFPDIGTINTQLLKLNLANYQPMKYIRPEKKAEYEARYDRETTTGSVFSQESREESLINLMRVNFLKRLESSIASFRITMERILNGIDGLISKVEYWQNNQGDLIIEGSITDDFAEDDLGPDQVIGEKVKVLIQDLDLIKYKDELQRDRESIASILKMARHVRPDRDAKLFQLKTAIRKKLAEPINEGNKKVLIFTAFADTADYLYANLATWVREEFGLFSGLVTGGSGRNKTNLPGSDSKFNDIIINFSPKSKGRGRFTEAITEEIDLLIGTDCISEGQNLQDCDYLVNYDIHWNPVRIVQRFGRIDRIGSTNAKIQLVNFWPNMELEAYINLINRVKGRMVILDISATGDENVIETDQLEGELDYRTRQLKQLKDRVVDLEDLQGGISITDLTFNDFKVDLDHLTPTERELLDMVIPGHFAVLHNHHAELASGAIFCLRDREPEMDGAGNNPLYPYYLVYVRDDGTLLFTPRQPKRTLDALRSLSLGATQEDLARSRVQRELVNSEAGLARYRKLLEVALGSIQGVMEGSVVDSLANPGGTAGDSSQIKVDRLELINFYVVV
ncbi:DEAD/DEAH box helicase [Neolewinella antarctica]|uniref:Helicase n=1 Tax=Neolewinella antarctica TaxID=442734 RepID=A0ABX0XCN9_9BACT|nr:DEAD/DEAH box helicase [Neolewinella antarctica]NJC27040.1 hypothetical protein [Neolewinella antarctica]